jgi:hypothetical protein
MEQKDMYTLDELFDNLPIALSELGRRSGINEVTLARIRDGNFARRSTIVNLLDALSKVHNVKLTLNNVSGLLIRDKKALQSLQQTTEKAEKAVEKVKTRQAKVIAEKAEKRPYTHKQDNNLPDGCILASKFTESHGVPRKTFEGHMMRGLGAGLIGTHTDTIPERDRVDYSERPKPNRPNEKEKYLDASQQKAALEFWGRHDVSFAECNDFGCWCHTIKNGE